MPPTGDHSSLVVGVYERSRCLAGQEPDHSLPLLVSLPLEVTGVFRQHLQLEPQGLNLGQGASTSVTHIIPHRPSM